MKLYTLNTLPEALFQQFTETSSGQSALSALRSELSNKPREVTLDQLLFIKESSDYILIIAVEKEALVGMVLGQLSVGIGREYLYLRDLVVAKEKRGSGVGALLMKEIITMSKKKWPNIVQVQLTSNPERGTESFYKKCGFRARTEESGDPTVMYVMDIDRYTS